MLTEEQNVPYREFVLSIRELRKQMLLIRDKLSEATPEQCKALDKQIHECLGHIAALKKKLHELPISEEKKE